MDDHDFVPLSAGWAVRLDEPAPPPGPHADAPEPVPPVPVRFHFRADELPTEGFTPRLSRFGEYR